MHLTAAPPECERVCSTCVCVCERERERERKKEREREREFLCLKGVVEVGDKT